MQYKEEMLRNWDSLDDCAGLEDVSSFEEWTDFDKRLKKKYGEEKVLLTCDKTNIASRKTIIKNGSILENEISDEANLVKSGIIQRYWVKL